MQTTCRQGEGFATNSGFVFFCLLIVHVTSHLQFSDLGAFLQCSIDGSSFYDARTDLKSRRTPAVSLGRSPVCYKKKVFHISTNTVFFGFAVVHNKAKHTHTQGQFFLSGVGDFVAITRKRLHEMGSNTSSESRHSWLLWSFHVFLFCPLSLSPSFFPCLHNFVHTRANLFYSLVPVQGFPGMCLWPLRLRFPRTSRRQTVVNV